MDMDFEGALFNSVQFDCFGAISVLLAYLSTSVPNHLVKLLWLNGKSFHMVK